ncbi:MAG: DUF799 family lipoprotein [Desulfosarcina sp.]|nr:DUF799 family lipoprotein [Desulfobacterales bacterium]
MTPFHPMRFYARHDCGRLTRAILSVGLIVLVIGCLSRQQVTFHEMTRPDPASAPRSIAVLPFQNATPQPDLGSFVRQSFYAHLSLRSFRDVELAVVEHVIAEHGLGVDTHWSADQIRVLGDWLGCDAVVIGDVNRFERIYAAIYSQLSIGASVTVYATRTGKKIWSDTYVARLHEGDIPLGPLGLPLSGIRTGLNLHDREIVTAVDKLTRHLAASIPDHGTNRPDKAGYRFELQIGAYLDHQCALDERDRLQKKGYPASVRSEIMPDAIWHRVVVGPYHDENKAIEDRQELESLLSNRPLIRRRPL